jgi:hypothetical protein
MIMTKLVIWLSFYFFYAHYLFLSHFIDDHDAMIEKSEVTNI